MAEPTLNHTRMLHDLLVSMQPEGAVHDEASCPVCITDQEAKVGDPKSYTEDELQAKITAAIAEAVAAKDAELNEIKAARASDEVASAVAEATAELATKSEALQAELDEAVRDAKASKDELDNVVAYLADVQSQGEREALAEERLTAIKATQVYPDAYVDTHPDRWVDMSSEDFDAEIAVLQASAEARGVEPVSTPVPERTAMTATAATDTAKSKRSPVSEVIHLRRDGVNVARLA